MMFLPLSSLTSAVHELWWIVLLVVCIGAAVAILFGIAIEAMKPEPPAPPYRIEFDDFYIDDRKG